MAFTLGKNLYYLVFLSFYFVTIAGGTTDHGATHNESTLKGLHLADFGELQGSFKQIKWMRDLEVEIKIEGNFKVLKPNKESSIFYWNIEKPKPSQICIDKIGILIETPSVETKKKDLKFSEVGKEVGDQITGLLKLIMMDQEKIVDEFEVKKNSDHFLLTPKKTREAVFEFVQLKINAEGFVSHVMIKEKSQDEIRIQFSGLKTKNFKLAKDVQCPR